MVFHLEKLTKVIQFQKKILLSELLLKKLDNQGN